FIAELDRLYRRCVRAATTKPDGATREAFEKLFALEAAVDEDPDAIVFFADEGGAWQFGTAWETVPPAWARCLAQTVAPAEFAREVDRVVGRYCDHDRARVLAAVKSVAPPTHQRALASMPARPRR